MSKELIKRSEVKIEDTWKVEDIYPTLADWENDLKKAEELAGKLAGLEGRLNTADNILESCRLEEEIDYIANRLFGYAGRVADVDTGNAENQKLVLTVRTKYVQISEQLSFIDPELLALPEGSIEKFCGEKPELERYRRFLTEKLRLKDHMLSPEMEKLLASAGEITGTASNTFSMFNNADLVFPEITDENGEKVRLTHGRYIPFLESQDRRVRKDAFKAMY
ncbi:MAG: oligoendopeptidase F, partial [Lachnospiraceae bacterium]|nr:oligoendopeptidase F [Lachnospiraceae bacterium]